MSTVIMESWSSLQLDHQPILTFDRCVFEASRWNFALKTEKTLMILDILCLRGNTMSMCTDKSVQRTNDAKPQHTKSICYIKQCV